MAKTSDTIVLKSHLGTAKSTAICDLIKKHEYESVVCITPRVMFANNIFASLKKFQKVKTFTQYIKFTTRHNLLSTLNLKTVF